MSIDLEVALERVLEQGDEWESWRALRASGDDPGPMPAIHDQDTSGGFTGLTGRISPGATGYALCHLVVVGLERSSAAAAAAEWLHAARTPAMAWLDPPDEVPGGLDNPGGARVWATASASSGLLSVGRDPGPRAIDLLRGEADMEGRFTGGAYPTFAAAAAYWLAEGPQTEMAEWALRWAREWSEDWWGAWERVTALTFWAAARIPLEHPTVEVFAETLRDEAPTDGWRDDVDLTLTTIELLRFLGD